jgi:hypothetical protein
MRRLPGWIVAVFLHAGASGSYSGWIASGVAPFEEKARWNCASHAPHCFAGRLHRRVLPEKGCAAACRLRLKRRLPRREACVCGSAREILYPLDECPDGMTCDFQNARCFLACKSTANAQVPTGAATWGFASRCALSTVSARQANCARLTAPAALRHLATAMPMP